MNKICADMELSPQHAALDYVISNDYIDQVIVEWKLWSIDLASTPFGNDLSLFNSLSLADSEILNPSLWNLNR